MTAKEINNEIRERIAISLVARDEEMLFDKAIVFWGKWKKELALHPEHFGDCTKEPQTCNRCLIDDYYKDADQIIRDVLYPILKIDLKKKLPRWQENHLCVDIFSYDSCQQDMVKWASESYVDLEVEDEQ